VKLKWFLATSGGGVEEMVFVKKRESCLQKERERSLGLLQLANVVLQ
jgi:hypothetical protein